MRAAGAILIAVLVVGACGGEAVLDTTTSTQSIAQQTTSTSTSAMVTTTVVTTTTTVPAASLKSLDSYRYRLELGIADDPLAETYQPITAIVGEWNSSPQSAQIYGVAGAERIYLVSDGVRWWDLAQTGEELTYSDVELTLAFNGYLLPSVVAPLLIDESAWMRIGTEEIIGMQAEVLRRTNIVKDVDWEYGDVTRIDVWRNDASEILKYVVWFATGDNTGFPVAIYEVVAANPEVEIELPDA